MKFQFSVILFALFPTAAFAADSAKEEKNVIPYGSIQSKYYLSNSAHNVEPEALVDIVRFGLRAKHGPARAGLEANLIGNETDYNTGSVVTSGKTLIRAAWLGIEFASDTFIQFGRIRPIGPATHGTDIPSTLQQYRNIDGARAIQTIALPEDGKIEFGLGVFNSLHSASYNGSTASGNFISENWNKTEKAWLGSVTANYKRITTHMWFGFERNAIVKANYTTTQSTTAEPDATALNANGLEVAAISHSEGSLGYDQDNFGFGVFFEQDILAKKKTANLGRGKLTTVADIANSKETTTTVAGAGANLNSKQFGITNMLQTDDAFTAGVAFTKKTVRENGTSEASQKGNDVNELTASVSYTVGGLDLALGLINEQTSAKSADFAGVDGQPQHSRTRSYINAAWEF